MTEHYIKYLLAANCMLIQAKTNRQNGGSFPCPAELPTYVILVDHDVYVYHTWVEGRFWISRCNARKVDLWSVERIGS